MKNTEPFEYFGSDLEALSSAHNYNNWIYSGFSGYVGNVSAEVGAGIGNFSELVLQSNTLKRLFLLEPSQNMFKLLEKRFKDNCRVITKNTYLSDQEECLKGSLDSILFINVLEHIEDDHVALKEAENALKSNGNLIIFVPACPFLYSRFDKLVGHHRRYTRKSLSTAARTAGFEIKSLKYVDMLGIIPWFLFFVLLRKIPSGTNISIYDKIAVPLISKIEKIVPPIIGKNLLLIAQKV